MPTCYSRDRHRIKHKPSVTLLPLQLVRKSLDSGITYFDTAEDYAKGGSELQLGRALAALPPADRARCVVGSKILPNNCGDVRKHCEATLARLGLESTPRVRAERLDACVAPRACCPAAIDLYMVHWPISASSMSHFAGAHTASGGRDYSTTGAVDESRIPSTRRAFEELKALQEEGKVGRPGRRPPAGVHRVAPSPPPLKIRHIGVSNFGVAQLKEALATGARIAANELVYNLITRAIETDILPFCRENGIQVIAYSALLQVRRRRRGARGSVAELSPSDGWRGKGAR